MRMKSGSRGGNFARGNEEEGAPKPLSATFFQEIQNLREKLKNEDDAEAKGECQFINILFEFNFLCNEFLFNFFAYTFFSQRISVSTFGKSHRFTRVEDFS